MKQKSVYWNQEKTICSLINSRIRGYFITYPWIFHYVTADISLNIHGYFSFYAMGMSFPDFSNLLFGQIFATLRSESEGFFSCRRCRNSQKHTNYCLYVPSGMRTLGDMPTSAGKATRSSAKGRMRNCYRGNLGRWRHDSSLYITLSISTRMPLAEIARTRIPCQGV